MNTADHIVRCLVEDDDNFSDFDAKDSLMQSTKPYHWLADMGYEEAPHWSSLGHFKAYRPEGSDICLICFMVFDRPYSDRPMVELKVRLVTAEGTKKAGKIRWGMSGGERRFRIIAANADDVLGAAMEINTRLTHIAQRIVDEESLRGVCAEAIDFVYKMAVASGGGQ